MLMVKKETLRKACGMCGLAVRGVNGMSIATDHGILHHKFGVSRVAWDLRFRAFRG